MRCRCSAGGFVTRCNAERPRATPAAMASTFAPPTAASIEHDPSFRAVLGSEPALERVVETDAHEGPVYVPEEDALYYTTVPRDLHVAIKRVAVADGTI